MSDISDLVTAIWPTTEGILSADSGVANFDSHKALAIARAKLALYGSDYPSDEDDIPEAAAYWIADQAVVFLIPLAIDFYMVRHRTSDSKENASVSYYDKIGTLEKLRDELSASLERSRATALEAASVTETADDTPGVSVLGLMVDPYGRARSRGIPGWHI